MDHHGNGGPLAADRWRGLCLSSVTTHDLPPTPGYLDGEHVRLRDELGLLTRPAEDELADDHAQRTAWMAELRRVGLLGSDGDEEDEEDITTALYRYLGRTPSRLLALALTDAVGERRTQNQPGTTDEYPNWRVPLGRPDGRPMWLEDVFTDRRAASVGRGAADRNRSGSRIGAGSQRGLLLVRTRGDVTEVLMAIPVGRSGQAGTRAPGRSRRASTPRG